MRMRPAGKDDEDTELIVEKVANDSLTISDKDFTFDYVADPEATQARII